MKKLLAVAAGAVLLLVLLAGLALAGMPVGPTTYESFSETDQETMVTPTGAVFLASDPTSGCISASNETGDAGVTSCGSTVSELIGRDEVRLSVLELDEDSTRDGCARTRVYQISDEQIGVWCLVG